MNKFKVGDIGYFWRNSIPTFARISHYEDFVDGGIAYVLDEPSFALRESDLFATPEECLLNKPI